MQEQTPLPFVKFEFDSTNAAPITRTHDCVEERFLTAPSKRKRPTSGSARATAKSALLHDARRTTPLDARMRASAPLDASATPSTTRARWRRSRDVRDTDSRVPSLGRAVNDADKWHVYCSLGAKHSQHDDVQTLPRVWTSLDFGCQNVHGVSV